jgi:hypothetical protein
MPGIIATPTADTIPLAAGSSQTIADAIAELTQGGGGGGVTGPAVKAVIPGSQPAVEGQVARAVGTIAGLTRETNFNIPDRVKFVSTSASGAAVEASLLTNSNLGSFIDELNSATSPKAFDASLDESGRLVIEALREGDGLSIVDDGWYGGSWSSTTGLEFGSWSGAVASDIWMAGEHISVSAEVAPESARRDVDAVMLALQARMAPVYALPTIYSRYVSAPLRADTLLSSLPQPVAAGDTLRLLCSQSGGTIQDVTFTAAEGDTIQTALDFINANVGPAAPAPNGALLYGMFDAALGVPTITVTGTAGFQVDPSASLEVIGSIGSALGLYSVYAEPSRASSYAIQSSNGMRASDVEQLLIAQVASLLQRVAALEVA